MGAPRILVFAGSIRTGSWNTKLAQTVARSLPDHGGKATLISLADFPMPIFNQDLEKEGYPASATNLAKLMSDHDGVMILSPEYNSSLPPLLKNTLDWVSRIKEVDGEKVAPYKNPVFAIGGVSNGAFGTIRNLLSLRSVLSVGLGALVVPEQLGVPSASTAFDERGNLTSDRVRDRMETTLTALVNVSTRMSKRVG